MHPNFVDISGQVFSRLTVLRLAESLSPKGRAIWVCKCSCGTEIQATGKNLRSGNTKSCGCLKSDSMRLVATKHGLMLKYPKEYKAWQNLLNRCFKLNPKKPDIFKAYWPRRPPDTWKEFSYFLSVMGPAPAGKGWSIDRINNSLGYREGNVRWADHRTQVLNREVTKLVRIISTGEIVSRTSAERRFKKVEKTLLNLNLIERVDKSCLI